MKEGIVINGVKYNNCNRIFIFLHLTFFMIFSGFITYSISKLKSK